MRRKRNVGGGVRGIGRDFGSLKETLAVTFIKRSYTGFRVFPQGETLENRCEVLVDFERDFSQ
jgi:hypothetical protein